MKNVLALLIPAFLLFAFAPPSKETFTVKTSESKVEWFGSKVTGKHNGLVSLKSGNLIMNGNKLTGGSFEMDMNSIDCTDLEGEWKDKLVGHLKADDFFGTDKFPTANFVITKVAAGKTAGSNMVTGKMTIKGKTQVVTFPVVLTKEGNNVKGTAEIKLDRTKYDIRYGSASFFNLGDKAISNDFTLKVALVASK
jgi:polyisoprenoid-binding protein YceI